MEKYPTQSVEEAVASIKKDDRRAYFIAYGRYVAVQLAAKHGSVHSRQVRAEMERRGVLFGYRGRDHWIGAVFQNFAALEPTGETFKYTDPARNVHERRVHVWRLKEGVRPEDYPKPQLPDWLRETWALRGIRSALLDRE